MSTALPDELDAKTISDIYGTPYVHEDAHGVEGENVGAAAAVAPGARGAEGIGLTGAGPEGATGAGETGAVAERRGTGAADVAELDRAAVAAVIEEAKAVTRTNA